ncbi:MAG: histidine triad nucleotide-binding protein [Polyangiaceae bacterium]
MCLFCKIVKGDVPAKVVLENDHLLAFHDINPAAPQHVLVITKQHMVSIHDATRDDAALLGELMLAGREVAEKLGLGESGYRLVLNTGKDAGQSVFHIHLHVLGGRPMAWPPG